MRYLVILVLFCASCMTRISLPMEVTGKHVVGNECYITMKFTKYSGAAEVRTSYSQDYCQYNIGDIIK
jgi:hypothetical protein